MCTAVGPGYQTSSDDGTRPPTGSGPCRFLSGDCSDDALGRCERRADGICGETETGLESQIEDGRSGLRARAISGASKLACQEGMKCFPNGATCAYKPTSLH